MITWGTNKIAVKYLTYPVSLYTIDFFVFVFIFHTIFSLTLGAKWFPPTDEDTFLNIYDILKQGPAMAWYKLGGPFVAGATTMGFTLIMFVLVDGYGLTSAIPLLFGSSMLLGVIITYFMQKKGNVYLIFSGVAVLFIAVVLNTLSSNMNQKCQRKKQEKDALLANAVDNEPASTEVAPKVPTESSAAPTAPLLEPAAPAVESSTAPAEPAAPAVESSTAPTEPAVESSTAPAEPATVSVESAPAVESSTAPADSTSVTIPAPEEPKKLLSMRSFIILGISAAVCDVFYAPCTAMGAKDPIPLSPYGIFQVVSLASVVTVFPFAYIVMRHPLQGKKCTFSDWIHATWAQRWPAIWSGFLLALGNFGYASAGSELGFAVGYALSRGTLLVSALLGVCVYKEYNGADCKTWTVQIIALLLFLTSIIMEAMASD